MGVRTTGCCPHAGLPGAAQGSSAPLLGPCAQPGLWGCSSQPVSQPWGTVGRDRAVPAQLSADSASPGLYRLIHPPQALNA